ncbi:MAG: hypothetical protein AB9903_35930 [Vulcanimicrobiota bacterium]
MSKGKKKHQQKKVIKKTAERCESEMSVDELLKEEERYLAEGNYRKLIFITRTLVQKGADAGTRLEHYTVLRAVQLAEKNLVPEALEFIDKISPSPWLLVEESHHDGLITLLLKGRRWEKALEMLYASRTGKKTEKRPGELSLDARCADFIILDEESSRFLSSHELFRNDAEAVFTAFSLLEKGDMGRAEDTLTRLPLRSPFRFWKLFLKGFCAFLKKHDREAAELLHKIPPLSGAAQAARSLFSFMSQSGQEKGSASSLLDEEILAASIWSAMDPKKSVDGLLFREMEAHLRDKRIPQALTTAEKILKGSSLTLVQRKELASFLWNILAAAGLSVPRKPLVNYPNLTAYIPDSPSLDRLQALQAEEMHTEKEEGFFRNLVSYLEKTHPVSWLDEKIQKQAQSLILLRIARIRRVHGDTSEDFLRYRQDRLTKRDIDYIEKTLERAITLYPSHKPLYHEAVSLFRDPAFPQSKRSKWLSRLSAAFPDDEDARMEALEADLQSGAMVRAKKSLIALAPNESLENFANGRLYRAFIDYARRMYFKKNSEEVSFAYETLQGRTEGQWRADVTIKYGCTLVMLGRKKEGEKIISEGLNAQEHHESGLLKVIIEYRRLNAHRSFSDPYCSELRKMIEKKSISSPLPLARLHHASLALSPYNNSFVDIELVLRVVSQFEYKTLSEEEYDGVISYLFHLVKLEKVQEKKVSSMIEKASKAFPSNIRFAFYRFVAFKCNFRPRSLNDEERTMMEKWRETLQQRHDDSYAEMITRFLNECRIAAQEAESAKRYGVDIDDFLDSFDESDDEYDDEISPGSRRGSKKKGGRRHLEKDDEIDPFFEMKEALKRLAVTIGVPEENLKRLIMQLPPSMSPEFKKSAAKLLRYLGLPSDPMTVTSFEMLKMTLEVEAYENEVEADIEQDLKGPKCKEKRLNYEQLELF